MKIHLLDPALLGFLGHHDHFAAGFLRSAAAFDVDLRIYGNRDVTESLQSALGLRPLFRLATYMRLSDDPYDALLHDLITGSRWFRTDLESLGEAAPGDDDLVLLPTAEPREVVGLGLWMQASGRKPRVAMIFHQLLSPDWDLAPGSLGGALYRRAGRAILHLMGSERCLVTATNSALARRLEAVLGCAVETVPVPVWYGGEAPEGRALERDGAPVIAFLGDMRREKGYERTPPLIRVLHARRLHARCLVHLGAGRDVPDLKEYKKLRDEGLAEVINGWIPGPELQGLLHRASLVVLPFERRRYRENISGIFSHAVAAGRPCVAPGGTWMAEQIRANRAAGICYMGEAVDDIADAVAEALASLPVLTQQARKAAPWWRREQCGPALVARVMKWAGCPEASPAASARRS